MIYYEKLRLSNDTDIVSKIKNDISIGLLHHLLKFFGIPMFKTLVDELKTIEGFEVLYEKYKNDTIEGGFYDLKELPNYIDNKQKIGEIIKYYSENEIFEVAWFVFNALGMKNHEAANIEFDLKTEQNAEKKSGGFDFVVEEIQSRNCLAVQVTSQYKCIAPMNITVTIMNENGVFYEQKRFGYVSNNIPLIATVPFQYLIKSYKLKITLNFANLGDIPNEIIGNLNETYKRLFLFIINRTVCGDIHFFSNLENSIIEHFYSPYEMNAVLFFMIHGIGYQDLGNEINSNSIFNNTSNVNFNTIDINGIHLDKKWFVNKIREPIDAKILAEKMNNNRYYTIPANKASFLIDMTDLKKQYDIKKYFTVEEINDTKMAIQIMYKPEVLKKTTMIISEMISDEKFFYKFPQDNSGNYEYFSPFSTKIFFSDCNRYFKCENKTRIELFYDSAIKLPEKSPFAFNIDNTKDNEGFVNRSNMDNLSVMMNSYLAKYYLPKDYLLMTKENKKTILPLSNDRHLLPVLLDEEKNINKYQTDQRELKNMGKFTFININIYKKK